METNKEKHKGEASIKFLTYLRTMALFSQRLRRCACDGFVHIPTKIIESDFFVYPYYNRKIELIKLIEAGKLEAKKKAHEGREMYVYKCLEPGPIDISLIETQDTQHYKPIHFHMRDMLKAVSLAPGAPSTVYFDAFLEYKGSFLNTFFRVDTATGRVYTPVTNFHRTHRPNILIDGDTTVSFDVATMQPQILGFILEKKVGENDFSHALKNGQDIYENIAYMTKSGNRDEGKKRFFEILFGSVNDDLTKMFGDATWIRWINEFKTVRQPNNPKTDIKRYGNMAWALTFVISNFAYPNFRNNKVPLL